MSRPHIEPFCDRDVHFKNMSMSGFPSGFTYKMLSLDTEIGSCTMTAQLAGGYKQKPGFSYSELEMIVVEGSIGVASGFFPIIFAADKMNRHIFDAMVRLGK